MFKNHIKIAFRNLWKNKGYSSLNIIGLAIGITCASLIFLWVENEFNYNSSIPEKDLVYYVPTNQMYEGEWGTFYSSPGPLAADLKEEIPEVVKAGRLWTSNFLFNVGDNTIKSSGEYADYDMIDIFGLSFIEGTKETAFNNPNSIIITQETAANLFGKNTQVLGKNVLVNNSENFIVTGVIKDLPDNTSFSFNWLVPFDNFINDNPWAKGYGNNFADTFVKLAPGVDVVSVDEKVRKILPSKKEENDTEAFLHSSQDWHLRSEFKNGKVDGGEIKFVQLFIIIAIIILVIACINFMNLATARSEKRANEVGVRKALGSEKKTLTYQFIIEAVITAALSSFISILLIILMLPKFNMLVEKQLTLGLNQPLHLLFFISITLLCGVFAGLYPAFYLSSFKPVEVLKGIRTKKSSAIFIRKGLVITQFSVSIIFIISTIIVYQQIEHVKNRELGFEKENLIEIPVNGNMISSFPPIQQDLISSGMFSHVALNSSKIFSAGYNGSGLNWQGGINTEDILIRFRWITSDFLNTAGMEIVEGRNFSKNLAKDSTNILVTQSFARLMGDDSPIGKVVHREQAYTVVGVVKDYLYGDMYGASKPLIFFSGKEDARFLYVKKKAGVSNESALAKLERVVNTYNPAFPFEYTFVEDSFDSRFRSETLIGDLTKVFALLAIFISCLGLFGLAAYTAEQRKKEIGIRKVLGASVDNLAKLLSSEFLKLVIISCIIAFPIAWFVMEQWLQDYAYRIEIHWWVFIAAGIAAICIAIITVSTQAIKAAIANPIKSLRAE
ncbi:MULTISPECIES: ABC transporter permease [Mesonia]|uniref:Macrolide export ATP-binding/permease protein MacB n=1 Tax=Mesonia oceanica TaxID=2687242 RepID=A0AC61YAT8_9FLAO|nr:MULTISPECIES: ABC transporter permease [Mesonia]MBJ96995.1 acetylornithine deacetylase [Flavobacteriaceae bacterium]MAN25941.1 acetylornithine deacetylase [Mesonia sp.]MAN26138.1 acetylornithine deacetylase [Mesonia sp.]MAQ39506.1 acetylornithine deacetylase [Mesonia sp.]VVV01609.1 Macrolide export ATP-binding/permease protein MacB [Mesonia oceanica]|tara:strand:- start:52336 stop:54687 length:2352 start_codon:yes stop_codon:yes gene_type:complete